MNWYNKEQAKELVKYINNCPALVSLFYDIDMLPEQLGDIKDEDYQKMLRIASSFMDFTQSDRNFWYQ